MILLYLASTLYHSVSSTAKVNRRLKNGSHDDLRDDRRQLHSCMPDRSPRTHRLYPLCPRMDRCHHRNDPQGLLDQLPEMAFLCDLHWNGLAVCTCFVPIFHNLPRAGFGWLLAGGIIYTIGGVIYALKLPIFNAKHKNFGSHEVFHVL